MKIKNTIIALLLLTGLAALLYFYEIPKEQEAEKQKQEEDKILSLDWEKVNDIRLERYKEIVHLKKDGDLWHLVQPVEDLADRFTISSLLGDLKALKAERSFEVAEDKMVDFLLDLPDMNATISTPEKSLTLFVGMENAVGNTQFVRLKDSGTVHLVSSSITTTVNKDIQSLRNKRVFNGLNKDALSSIEVFKEDRKLYALRRNDQTWWLSSPIEALADQDEVDKLVNYMLYLNIRLFFSEQSQNPEIFGLKPPRHTLVLKEREKAWPKLLIGDASNNQEDVYAKRADKPAIWFLPGDVPERIAPSLYTLREKKILREGTDEISQLELHYPNHSVSVTLSDGEWIVPGSEERKVDANKVESALQNLRNLKALEFFEQAKQKGDFGFEDRSLSIRLKHAGGKVLADLIVGKPKDEDRVYLTVLPDLNVVSVDRSLIDVLPKSAEDLFQENVEQSDSQDSKKTN